MYLVRDVAAAGGASGLLPTTSDVQHLFALKRVRGISAVAARYRLPSHVQVVCSCTAVLAALVGVSAAGWPLLSPSCCSSCGAQMLCGSEDQLREAEHEVAVMRRLRHPCLLPLLDASTQLQRTPDGGSRHVVLMLVPGEHSHGI